MENNKTKNIYLGNIREYITFCFQYQERNSLVDLLIYQKEVKDNIDDDLYNYVNLDIDDDLYNLHFVHGGFETEDFDIMINEFNQELKNDLSDEFNYKYFNLKDINKKFNWKQKEYVLYIFVENLEQIERLWKLLTLEEKKENYIIFQKYSNVDNDIRNMDPLYLKFNENKEIKITNLNGIIELEKRSIN